jgi:glycosyltransferase involved in cell wall biosynthesis
VSPGLYKLLLRNGASAGSTFVIPNYFGEADLEERSASANPDQDHSKTGDFIVVYAGSLGQAANVSTCLDAADILMRRGYTALRFVFMGAGERRQEYMTSCRDRGLDNVEFPGVVPRSYMQAVFAKAHVAVHAFPQHPYWRCALSSKVFEYMHAGIPIVFSGEGDIASVIKESGGGIVVPPEDPNALAEALVHLMETPGQRALMGNRAAEYVRTCFSRDSIRETFAEAFRVHGGGFTI